MRFYSKPIEKRRADANRYWSDEQVRLRKVNRLRAERGRPLFSSVEQIGRENFGRRGRPA